MHRKLLVGCVACGVLAVLAGCGGGDGGSKGSTESFPDQIDKAMKKEPAPRARLLVKIAVKQGKAQDLAGAKDTLNRAFQACKDIEEPAAKASAFADLAQAQADLSFSNEARNSARSSLEAAEKIDGAEEKAKAVSAAARALGVAGDGDKALAALKEAETLAGKIQDSTGRVLVLCSTAVSYERIKKSADADRVLAETLTYAATLDAKSQAIAMASVAQEQATLKRPDAAKTFDAALETARKSNDPGDRVIALTSIAEKLSKAGNAKLTHEVLKEAEGRCKDIKAADQQQQLLGHARDLMNKLPKPE